MVLAPTREHVFYCTIWQICSSDRAKVTGWHMSSASVSGSLSEETTRCPIYCPTRRYSPRRGGDKRCWKRHGPPSIRASELIELLHISTNHCTYRESVNLGTQCGYFNPWQAKCDNRSGAGWLCCRSPHLPLVWLFQQCSSSGSVSLPLAQMSSDRLDQNLLDSFSLSLMSVTCHGPKHKAEPDETDRFCILMGEKWGWEVRWLSSCSTQVHTNPRLRTIHIIIIWLLLLLYILLLPLLLYTAIYWYNYYHI